MYTSGASIDWFLDLIGAGSEGTHDERWSTENAPVS